ncbi:class I SAM-dependent methyltransferase [Sediminibacterium sp. C3]|uniref:class I SAM-dependent methyltransferase n=1 Tax=Sediminibacterium sp. C3 TaxID=1267211 RepID=UPI00040B72A9|nr:class I SAM-dependent methyltransferase [Sediminibacterium sp. C3]
MESEQKNAFLKYEADKWFLRNSQAIKNYNSSKDEVINIIKEYNLEVNSVLELGSSAGYRLNAIKSLFPTKNLTGLEPSKLAIEYGQENYPSIHFVHGTADNLSCLNDNSYDLVIVGFILYVIDRNLLLKVISEIDRVLKDGGVVILVDFFSEKPVKNSYEHIHDLQAFSFKQNYDEIFTSSKLYYLLDKSSFSHDNKIKDVSSDYHNKYSISVLKKDLTASYK